MYPREVLRPAPRRLEHLLDLPLQTGEPDRRRDRHGPERDYDPDEERDRAPPFTLLRRNGLEARTGPGRGLTRPVSALAQMT